MEVGFHSFRTTLKKSVALVERVRCGSRVVTVIFVILMLRVNKMVEL